MIKNINIEEFNIENEENELIEEFRAKELYKLFNELEDSIAECIIDTILYNTHECNIYYYNNSYKSFICELKDAINRFIIVEKDTDEEKQCKEEHKIGNLMFCEFKGMKLTNKRLYYEI